MEVLEKFFSFNSDKGSFLLMFTEGFNFPPQSAFTIIVLIITFAMIDLFDSIGTDVGCATNAGLLDERGFPKNYNKMVICDSIATCVGAVYGTSTVTTFVESGAGIAVGGKTGLTALTTACLFLLSVFLMPIFAFIPSSAAASALIYVGVLMMGCVHQIDFTNIQNAVPAFLTIIGMPFTYSINKGIGLGILSYILISVINFIIDKIKVSCSSDSTDVLGIEEKKELKWPVSFVTAIIGIFFIIYLFAPTSF
jgi:AGZA family xanthine/uracil permease-like MFS transporter